MAKDSKKRNRSAERVATANAKTATANAEAAKASAEAARVNAELERDRIAAQGEKRSFDMQVTAATYGAGLVGGKVIAAMTDRKLMKSLDARNKALADLSKVMQPLAKKSGGSSPVGVRASAQINAAGKVGKKTGITNPKRGAAGLVTGAGLIAMGLFTRNLGSSSSDPTEKTIYTALGTAEIVAGGTVIYSDMVSRMAPKALPDVKALATIAQAEAVAKPNTPALPDKAPKAPAAPAAKSGRAAAVTQRASKAVTAANKASKAMVGGMSMAGRAAAVTGGVLKRVALPVFAGIAAVGAMQGSAQAGESTAQNIASGVMAAADSATFGVPGMIADSVKNRETIKYDAKEMARRVNVASAEKKLATGAKLTRAEELAMQESTTKNLPSFSEGMLTLTSWGATAGSGVALASAAFRAASGNGRVKVALGTAAALFAVGAAARSGRGYLNDAAKSNSVSTSAARLTLAKADAARTTSAMARTDVPVAPRTATQPLARTGKGQPRAKAADPGPDTFAEGYTRTRNGRTEQVQGYHIQPRRS